MFFFLTEIITIKILQEIPIVQTKNNKLLYKSNKYNEFLLKKEEEKKIKKQKQEEEKKIKKQKEEEEKKQKKQKQNNQKNFGLKNSSINCYFNSAIQILNLDENFKSLVNSGKNKK